MVLGWWPLNCLKPEGRGCSGLFLTTHPAPTAEPSAWQQEAAHIYLFDGHMAGRALKSLELWNIDLCTNANANWECLFYDFPLQLVMAT